MNTRTDPRNLRADPHTRLPPAPGPAAGPAAIPEHDARCLTGLGGLARITLDGHPYALRITRLGKLILTK